MCVTCMMCLHLRSDVSVLNSHMEAFCNIPEAEYTANCVYLAQRTLHCNPAIDFPLTPSALYV